MGKDIITHGKIIDLTREVVRGFYSRQIDHLIHYMSEDFVWIGAFDFQFATSKQEFLEIVQSELDAIPFNIEDEHYDIITRDRDTFVLYCKFSLSNLLEDGSMLQMRTRLSVVWKRIDGELKLLHVHGSNAQDIPITAVMPSEKSQSSNGDFINYITSYAKAVPSAKKMFHLTSGGHSILAESDILYLQADGQNTRVHTVDGVKVVTGILRSHQSAMSDTFFRVHKTYFINTSYITVLKRYQVTLNNEITLPVSREKYMSLKQLYSNK